MQIVGLNLKQQNKLEIKNVPKSIISSQIASSRRPSLPILDKLKMGPPSSPINLPLPIRRHSVDLSILRPSFTSSGTQLNAILPQITEQDFSQKLAEFNFNQNIHSTLLPCIEPEMNRSSSHLTSQNSNKNAFPDWFIAEKNRILGSD